MREDDRLKDLMTSRRSAFLESTSRDCRDGTPFQARRCQQRGRYRSDVRSIERLRLMICISGTAAGDRRVVAPGRCSFVGLSRAWRTSTPGRQRLSASRARVVSVDGSDTPRSSGQSPTTSYSARFGDRVTALKTNPSRRAPWPLSAYAAHHRLAGLLAHRVPRNRLLAGDVSQRVRAAPRSPPVGPARASRSAYRSAASKGSEAGTP